MLYKFVVPFFLMSALVGSAANADVPDLVGTWRATEGSFAAVRVGAENDHHPKYPDPIFASPEHVWSIVIDEQRNRAFHGKSVSPEGREEPLVGVVTADGTHLIIAAEEAGLFGQVIDDKIEFCFQDHDSDRAGVACYIAEKTPE
jgi:hypothetical protein